MPHGEPQVAQQASVAKQSTRHTCAAHMQILKRTPRPHRCPTCKQSICSDLASFKPNRTATNLIRRMADLHLDLEEERSRSRTRSPPPRGYVQLFVRCWAGNTIVLDVPPDSDVQYIKELVFRREGTSASIACVFAIGRCNQNRFGMSIACVRVWHVHIGHLAVWSHHHTRYPSVWSHHNTGSHRMLMHG